MLSRLLSWLFRASGRTPSGPVPRVRHPRSATAHLFDKPPVPPARKPGGSPSTEGDFNPYNTGKFDRSASWERISKNQR